MRIDDIDIRLTDCVVINGAGTDERRDFAARVYRRAAVSFPEKVSKSALGERPNGRDHAKGGPRVSLGLAVISSLAGSQTGTSTRGMRVETKSIL